MMNEMIDESLRVRFNAVVAAVSVLAHWRYAPYQWSVADTAG